MKKTLLAAAALIAMTACTKENIIMTSEAGYGYIDFGVSTDTELVVTKGLSSSTDLSGYNFTLKNEANSSYIWQEKEYNTIDADACKVPAGKYYVSVQNLTDAEAHPNGQMGSVQVKGEVSNFNVTAGATQTCTVNCTPINSKVSCIYTQKFYDVFGTSAAVTLDPGSSKRNLAMTMTKQVAIGQTQTYGSEAYFPANQTVTWELVGTASGVQKKFSNTFNTQAGKWSVITFDISGDSGVINITVTVNGQISEVVSVDGSIDPIVGGTVVQ